MKCNEMMKRLLKGVLIFGLIVPILAGCGGGGRSAGNKLTAEQQATVDSLQLIDKINNAALYEVTYSADYIFDRYLQVGSSSLTKMQNFFVDNLFNQQPVTASKASNFKYGCASFSAKDENGHHLFVRNWDHSFGDPISVLVLHTKPTGRYASISMVYLPYCRNWGGPDVLVSPYLTMDGMNEAGLATSLLDTNEANSGHDPNKTTIWYVCIMRLLLDHAKDVGEAITLLQRYNYYWNTPNHIMIADRSGNSVVVEFHGGEMCVIKSGKAWQVVTNYDLYGKDPEDLTHCQRYQTVWAYLKSKNGIVANSEAMTLSSSISQSSFWSAVYDLETGEVHLAVARNYQKIKTFNLVMSSSNQ